MKRDLERRLEDLEQQQDPVKYEIRWLEPDEEPSPDAIRLKWLDELK